MASQILRLFLRGAEGVGNVDRVFADAGPDGEPPRPQVRCLLERLIPQPAEFDRFLETQLLKIWMRLGSDMNRVSKTNELLAIVPTHQIMPLLADRPDYDRLRLGLTYDLYYSEHWTPEARSA